MPAQAQDLAALHEVVENKDQDRVVFEFDVPQPIAAETSVQTLGIVQITARAELKAGVLGDGKAYGIAHEMAKASIAEINGKPVHNGDGVIDAWWNDRKNSKLRTLVLAAYGQINEPAKDQTEGFLKSRRVRAG